MFIGVYTLENKTYYNIYDKKNGGFDVWYNETFSPDTKDINILNFVIYGYSYGDKKNYLKDLAIKWQLEFAQYSWSYYELYVIQNWFYKNAKRYGLLKEFKENGIC